MNTYHAIRACAIALLAGAVLHACDVTAGRGIVVDWRTVKSGDTLAQEVSAFDAAQLFVALVGAEAAMASISIWIEPAPKPAPAVPSVVAFAWRIGTGRRRFFRSPQGFDVYVEPDQDDAAQAAFTARLAALCASHIPSE